MPRDPPGPNSPEPLVAAFGFALSNGEHVDVQVKVQLRVRAKSR